VIRGAGLITNPPSDVKFLTAYFDKALSLLAARQGGQLRIPVPRPAPSASAEGSEEAASGESGGEPTASAPEAGAGDPAQGEEPAVSPSPQP